MEELGFGNGVLRVVEFGVRVVEVGMCGCVPVVNGGGESRVVYRD